MNYNFNSKDLKLLNSNLAIKMMLKQNEVDPKRVLRYVKYEREVEKMQVDLIKLQHWVINENKRLCIIFEGRDAAGKGGAIRRITHHLNPRNQHPCWNYHVHPPLLGMYGHRSIVSLD